MKKKIILHACTRTDWKKAQDKGEYTAPSLATQGFIHCSEIKTIVGVANFNWKGRRNLILLVIDSNKVKSKIKYEIAPESGIFYPHIYGPLNLDAVMRTKAFLPSSNGSFNQSSVGPIEEKVKKVTKKKTTVKKKKE